MGLFSTPEKPTLIEAVRQGPWTGRSDDPAFTPETLAAVTAINQQIKELAPVLNSTKETGTLTIAPATSPVAALLKRHGSSYVFAVNLSPQPADAAFAAGSATSKKATVLGESREIAVEDGKFTDHFEGYAVHLYRLP